MNVYTYIYIIKAMYEIFSGLVQRKVPLVSCTVSSCVAEQRHQIYIATNVVWTKSDLSSGSFLAWKFAVSWDLLETWWQTPFQNDQIFWFLYKR